MEDRVGTAVEHKDVILPFPSVALFQKKDIKGEVCVSPLPKCSQDAGRAKQTQLHPLSPAVPR